jgi:hypothetical protein
VAPSRMAWRQQVLAAGASGIRLRFIPDLGRTYGYSCLHQLCCALPLYNVVGVTLQVCESGSLAIVGGWGPLHTGGDTCVHIHQTVLLCRA